MGGHLHRVDPDTPAAVGNLKDDIVVPGHLGLKEMGRFVLIGGGAVAEIPQVGLMILHGTEERHFVGTDLISRFGEGIHRGYGARRHIDRLDYGIYPAIMVNRKGYDIDTWIVIAVIDVIIVTDDDALIAEVL